MISESAHPFGDFSELLKLAEDEQFKSFFEDPRVRALFLDTSFRRTVEEKNLFKLAANPKFMELMGDPSIRAILAEMSKKIKK